MVHKNTSVIAERRRVSATMSFVLVLSCCRVLIILVYCITTTTLPHSSSQSVHVTYLSIVCERAQNTQGCLQAQTSLNNNRNAADVPIVKTKLQREYSRTPQGSLRH
mmetsp:Transcript_22737/g.63452  ORF Transcript_22737/g.63452 Transcript_22737/m.63452 type:complete len:107 (+) Transcript_22737:229-549(+)